MNAPRRLLAACAFFFAVAILPARAALAADPAYPAYPAFEASSELFELVGRIKDGRLTLTLDRWASNEPVSGAGIEIDSGGRVLRAEALADGSYAVDAAPFAAPASYPLTITVSVGDDSDLLAADLVVDAAASTPSGPRLPGSSNILFIAAGLALLAGFALSILRRRRAAGEQA